MRRPRTILLVDPDPSSAAALGPALRRQGFHVQSARDGSRALQLAVLRSPDLVLLDDGTPLVSAPTVARILRSNPRTSTIPILRTGRGEPVRPGEPFLRKPFDVDAVLAAITGALAGRDVAAKASVDAALEGRLEQLPLVDVVQMLSANNRTGRLVVDRERGSAKATDRTEILFEDGRVVDAIGERTTGAKAFVRLLAIRSGQFTFVPGAVTAPPRIGRRTDELLLDGLRQSDELAALGPRLPAPSTALVVTSAVRVATGAAVEEVRQLLAAPATVRDVLDRASASDVEAGRAIAALLAAGEVERVPDPGSPARPRAVELLGAPEIHALRSRLRERRVANPDRADREVVVAKVLLAGAGELATRAALGRLATVTGFEEVEGVAATFGTAARIDLGALRLDVIVLPCEPAMWPLWRVLAAGAVCAIVLAPADPIHEPIAALAEDDRCKVGVCGASPEAFQPGALASTTGWCGYVGSDPVAAVRALLARAAARDPASPA